MTRTENQENSKTSITTQNRNSAVNMAFVINSLQEYQVLIHLKIKFLWSCVPKFTGEFMVLYVNHSEALESTQSAQTLVLSLTIVQFSL